MIPAYTFDEFQTQAHHARRLAVFEEISTHEHLTPAIIYALMSQTNAGSGVMLETHQPRRDLQVKNESQYSFIGFEPIATLNMNLDHQQDPLKGLRHHQTQYAFETRASVKHLITSAMGFITYDAVRFFEKIPDRHAPDESLPTLLFNFYALSITFDHTRQTLFISTIVDVGQDHQHTYQQARQKITATIALLQSAKHEPIPSKISQQPAPINIEPCDADFICMIEKAKKHILIGDAFQIVLSRSFKRPYSVPPFEIYQTLRQVSPSPFMFYFPTESQVIIGASPERLVRVHQQRVTVNPIAGTRRRSETTTDQEISTDLLRDEKELAEHRMLVDLARNDVGSVSQPGTVQVTELMDVKHYSHVSHITSTVTGRLQQPYDALDALAACFPAGTLSGAPKIRAMQIIDELETSRRGMYGGSICRLDAVGDLESCIAIRMAVLQHGTATIRTGAGIVHDSNSVAEAEETRQKAAAMLDAIAQAHGESNAFTD